MRGRYLRRFLPAPFLLSILALAFSTSTPGGPGRNPHAHFRDSGKCPRCHAYRDGRPDPGRILEESTGYCLECHSGQDPGRTHPIRIPPVQGTRRMRIPGDYALDVSGRLMCLTCHTAHGPFLSTVRAGKRQRPVNTSSPSYYRTYFVRRSDPSRGFAALCDGCHGGDL